MPLTKDQILSASSKLKTREVPVPEWGDGATVTVRELSGDERDAYDQQLFQHRDDFRGLRSFLVAMSLCDESGNSLGFTEAEVKQLGRKSGAAIDRLFEAAKKLSGLDGDAVEDAEKN